jgi:hypothetical protein
MLPARRPIPVGHNRHRSKVILFFEGVDRARSQVAGGECVRTSSRNFERSSDRRMAGECAGMVSGAGAGTHDWGGAVQRRKKKGELCSVLLCLVPPVTQKGRKILQINHELPKCLKQVTFFLKKEKWV